MKNTQKRNLWISYGIAFTGVAFSLMPQFVGISPYDGGGAITLGGAFIALSAWLVGLLLFKEKSRVMDEAMDERKVIAKWVYDSSTWRRKMIEEKQDMRTASIGMMIMILVVGTIVFVPMLIALDEKLIVLVIYGVLILFGGFGIYLNYRHIRYIEDKAYVIITKDGAVLNGDVECWRGRGREFDRAEFDRESQSINVKYKSYFTKGDWDRTIAIPVPDYISFDRERVVAQINME